MGVQDGIKIKQEKLTKEEIEEEERLRARIIAQQHLQYDPRYASTAAFKEIDEEDEEDEDLKKNKNTKERIKDCYDAWMARPVKTIAV
jgi:hypothetical protein